MDMQTRDPLNKFYRFIGSKVNRTAKNPKQDKKKKTRKKDEEKVQSVKGGDQTKVGRINCSESVRSADWLTV